MPLIEGPQIFLLFAPALQVIPLLFDSLLAIEPQLFLLCSKSFLAIEPQHLPLWFKSLLAFEPQFLLLLFQPFARGVNARLPFLRRISGAGISTSDVANPRVTRRIITCAAPYAAVG